MSSADQTTTDDERTRGGSARRLGGATAIAVLILVSLGIKFLGVIPTWWAMLAAVAAELIALALVVLVIQSVTTTRPDGFDALMDVANRGEGQDELSEHDVPLGAPERSAVRHAHEHDHNQTDPGAAAAR
jgi:hypothetical protein